MPSGAARRCGPRDSRALAWALLLLVTPLVAGCLTAPEEDAPDSPFGACPHWVERAQPVSATVTFNATSPRSDELVPKDEVGTIELYDGEYAFDLVVIEILDTSTNGTIQLMAHAADGDRRLRIYDYGADGPISSVLTVDLAGDGEAGRVLEVYLTAVDQKAPADPGPVRLTWSVDEGDAEVVFQISYWDRVCGA